MYDLHSKRPFSFSLMFHRENNVCDLRALNFIVLWSYLGEKMEKFDTDNFASISEQF